MGHGVYRVFKNLPVDANVQPELRTAALEFELLRVPGVGLDICYFILSHKQNFKWLSFWLLELGFYFAVSSTFYFFFSPRSAGCHFIDRESEVQNS